MRLHPFCSVITPNPGPCTPALSLCCAGSGGGRNPSPIRTTCPAGQVVLNLICVRVVAARRIVRRCPMPHALICLPSKLLFMPQRHCPEEGSTTPVRPIRGGRTPVPSRPPGHPPTWSPKDSTCNHRSRSQWLSIGSEVDRRGCELTRTKAGSIRIAST